MPNDPTESLRRQRLQEINSVPGDRAALEARHGKVWDAQQLAEEFEVIGYAAPFVVVTRRSDGAKGTMEFQHTPRYYFAFVIDTVGR